MKRLVRRAGTGTSKVEEHIATLHDVAKLAAVSPSTVSRILKVKEGEPIPFSSETQTRVRHAATRLGYRPSKLARGLVGSRTGIVGLVVPSLEDSFFPGITAALQATLNASGYNLLLVDAKHDSSIESRSIDDFLAWRVDGLVIAPSQSTVDAALFWELWRLRVPFVLIDRTFADTPFFSVTTDDRTGAMQATEHLIGLGRTRIACVGSALPVSTARVRHAGYAEALLRGGLAVDPRYDLQAEPTISAGAVLLERLLALRPMPDALFCFSDMVAIGVVEACLERGVRIPDDLAVIGYADLEMSRFSKIRLTTVRQPRNAIGETAARMLLRRIAREEVEPAQAVLPVELIVRESTGMPAAPTSRKTKRKATKHDRDQHG